MRGYFLGRIYIYREREREEKWEDEKADIESTGKASWPLSDAG